MTAVYQYRILFLLYLIYGSLSHDPSCPTIKKVVHPHMKAQCISEHRDGKDCLKLNNYGLPEISCDQILTVFMENDYSNDILLNSLGDMDSIGHKSPPMAIRVSVTNISITFDEMKVEREIDRFLTYRPWWKISHDSGIHAVDRGTFTVVFERYPIEWRPYLEFLVKTQYLTSDHCKKTPFIAGRMPSIHPGMMPVLNVFSGVKRRFPYSVFIYYWPIANAFVSISDCEGILNKWECAFLPMTNCSLPRIITDCMEETCLSKQVKGQMWVTVSNESTIDGINVPDVDKEPQKAGKFPFDHFKSSGIIYHDPGHFKFALPYNESMWRVDYPDTHWGLFTFLFMARPNAFFRTRIKKLVHDMRSHSTPHFHSTTPCVAVHIRRGDRIRAGVNMLEYCANVSYDRDPSHTIKRGCVNMNHPDQFGSCPPDTNPDLGCKTLPFEAVRLRHIVSKIPSLVNPVIHDLLVFTDDPIFLQEQTIELAKTDPQWRIHTFRPPELPKNVDIDAFHKNYEVYEKAISHIRSRAGTDSGVLFQTSLRASQQCSAFIGHFGSGVSSLFYHAMCVEHGGRYGVCPPAYDFRWGL